MKRAANFNPVYPFEEQTQPNTALPPFFSSDGLEEQPGGKLALKITNPLGFDLDGRLKLKLGDGFRLDVNGALENTQTLEAQAPLQLQDEQLSLKFNSSSLFVNGSNELDVKHQQAVTVQPPLKMENDQISLMTNNTLAVENNQLKISLHSAAPITISGGNYIQFQIENKGLKIEQQKLKLNINLDNLFFNEENKLDVRYDTLWTGVITINNAYLIEGTGSLPSSANAHVDLVLTKTGPMVHGLFRVSASSSSLENKQTGTVHFNLYFDNLGNLRSSTSSLKTLYYKDGVQDVTIPANSKNLHMMPNVVYYPRHQTTGVYSDYRVYERMLLANNPPSLGGTAGINYVVQMQYNAFPNYNTTSDNGYSIIITIDNFRSDNFKGLKTGWLRFSYLSN